MLRFSGTGKCIGLGLVIKNQHVMKIILWRILPVREMLKHRNLEERDCTTAVEYCRALPPLPSPRFAPHHAFLGYVVNTGSCNSKEVSHDLRDVTRNNTQHCTLPHVRLQRL
jgi:hypothetical protein